jgi:1-aminocyclopropane-1-carboxylate deaminase/D-cysteine desulfhydrase-like pyridoxal-dependent ACC family enzyme
MRDRPGPQASRPADIALFRHYPELGERLPRIALAELPTPVKNAEPLARALGLKSLYLKRDDLSGRVYGGNKVRKLEFLFGRILRTGAKTVMTAGFAGSNHALATAIYGQQVGLRCVSLLMAQENAHYLRGNLLAAQQFGARLCHYQNLHDLRLGFLWQYGAAALRDRALPRFIPPGASCPLGIVGYVSAAFELREQIAAGLLPAPDVIYVPTSSMGTAAGLIVGLRAAGLKARVVPVRVIDENLSGSAQMRRLVDGTVSLLRRLAPAFPRVELTADWPIRDDCLGEGYARFTARGVEAAELVQRYAGITLDGTNSAKAFAALLDDAAQKRLRDATVLFWNTYNSRDLSAIAAGGDYRRLPRGFQRYFEEDVQPLDRSTGDR